MTADPTPIPGQPTAPRSLPTRIQYAHGGGRFHRGNHLLVDYFDRETGDLIERAFEAEAAASVPAPDPLDDPRHEDFDPNPKIAPEQEEAVRLLLRELANAVLAEGSTRRRISASLGHMAQSAIRYLDRAALATPPSRRYVVEPDGKEGGM